MYEAANKLRVGKQAYTQSSMAGTMDASADGGDGLGSASGDTIASVTPPVAGVQEVPASKALQIPRPTFRRLRGYAFDPSLSVALDTAVVNQLTYKVKWEDLGPGPVGDYLEVVDYDPASKSYYAPVDLNDPLVIAQDGLPPSEGSPQFHQQMVYAAAMTTIRHFERALGRFALWSRNKNAQKLEDQYVARLRIYPHALREANAYYSPEKKAILFGYFPASADNPGDHYPGGVVFSCLSHDIIAHETTHALLDGMHEHFIEPTNPDVRAFHEAFADIVALFQRFSYPEVLRHQIARTRGDLASQNLLGELAQQFGKATGQYGALRSAIGQRNKATGQWEQLKPDPSQYRTVREPHRRGAILVAAVFDAFLSIYKNRVVDLLRIATNGTGVLQDGALHPDLVNRLAEEAAKSAGHVLDMCVRALDYCPPIDITFGDYLRAIITADSDLVPADDLRYRVAFIEAFRRRGIYPPDVRTLSEDSLRWPTVREEEYDKRVYTTINKLAGDMRSAADKLGYSSNRFEAFMAMSNFRIRTHDIIKDHMSQLPTEQQHRLLGLVVSWDGTGSEADIRDQFRYRDGEPDFPRFVVYSVRPARRIGPDGSAVNQMVISITQTRDIKRPNGPTMKFRGGSTLILDLDNFQLDYQIVKPVIDPRREEWQSRYQGASGASLRATYLGEDDGSAEPFAALHRDYEEGGLL